MAIERALAVIAENGKVMVIAGISHIPHVAAGIAKLDKKDKKRVFVIGEPAAKNTAPAIACAVKLASCNEAGNMLVLTSDHIIKPQDIFCSDAAKAAAAANEQNLVVFGIPPSRAETGYGYIEIKKQSKTDDIFAVAAFHEKPDLQTAKKYAASKSFFWNSGMFAFSVRFMAEQMRTLAPYVFLPFENLKHPKKDSFSISKGVQILNGWQGLENSYKKTKAISFDYAIAEKCKKTVMVRTNFDWIDIGNWEEYASLLENARKERGAPGIFKVESDTCFVDSDIPAALAGVEDLIIVIRSGKNGFPACALVTKKGKTQLIRKVVDQIKKSGKTDIL